MKNFFKKFLLLFVIMMMVVMPVNADEISDKVLSTTTVSEYDLEEFVADAKTDLSFSKSVLGNALLAGNNVNIEGKIEGILFLAGNNVNHKGSSEYALIAGNLVNIIGDYEKDVMIVGNAITLSTDTYIGRDMLVAGSTVTISGNIGRNISIYADRVIMMNAVISGDAKIVASNVTIEDTSSIAGKLTLDENSTNTVSSQATIGSIEYKDLSVDIDKDVKVNVFDTILEKLISYAGILCLFVVSFLIFPKIYEKTGKQEFSVSKILNLCGNGLLLLVFTPIVSIILMVLVIGIPLAIISLLLYGIALYSSKIFAGYYVGKFVWNKCIKKNENILLEALVGISLLYIAKLIPVLGVIVSILSFLVGLGLIIETVKKK